jgi:hypothetical protein
LHRPEQRVWAAVARMRRRRRCSTCEVWRKPHLTMRFLSAKHGPRTGTKEANCPSRRGENCNGRGAISGFFFFAAAVHHGAGLTAYAAVIGFQRFDLFCHLAPLARGLLQEMPVVRSTHPLGKPVAIVCLGAHLDWCHGTDCAGGPICQSPRCTFLSEKLRNELASHVGWIAWPCPQYRRGGSWVRRHARVSWPAPVTAAWGHSRPFKSKHLCVCWSGNELAKA